MRVALTLRRGRRPADRLGKGDEAIPVDQLDSRGFGGERRLFCVAGRCHEDSALNLRKMHRTDEVPYLRGRDLTARPVLLSLNGNRGALLIRAEQVDTPIIGRLGQAEVAVAVVPKDMADDLLELSRRDSQ